MTIGRSDTGMNRHFAAGPMHRPAPCPDLLMKVKEGLITDPRSFPPGARQGLMKR